MVEMLLKHVNWSRRKLAGFTETKQSELCQLCAFTIPRSEGYCEYTFHWPIKNSNHGQQCNGLDKCPTDLRLPLGIDHLALIDRWSTWVHSLDCLFKIYKLSMLKFRFLKTFSSTEVINKGVLLNWMSARYIQDSFGKSKFFWTGLLGSSIIIGGRTLSKFLIKIISFLLELRYGLLQKSKVNRMHSQRILQIWPGRYEIPSLSQYHYVFE